MLKNTIRFFLKKLGYEIFRVNSIHRKLPPDFERRHIEIINKVISYSITSEERIYALIESVRYILKNDIKGDFVECGVYKGGSMMAVALTLLTEGINNRDLYLFDTFEGMPAPGKEDIDLWGRPASEVFHKKRISDVSSTWMNSSLAEVKQAMASTGYPAERMHFIKGLVENTIPEKAPELISLLRLDTDWYKSTIHEMVHLYPRLSSGGIVIVDDYGHFSGAKKAVDEYFQTKRNTPYFHRIDYTGRLAIKYLE